MRKYLRAASVSLGIFAVSALGACSGTHQTAVGIPKVGSSGDVAQATSQGVGYRFGLSTKNVMHRYRLRHQHASPLPFSVASGSDGNVWFTEFNAPRIGKITPDGIITEYNVPSASHGFYIAAGVPGTLWYTQEMSDQIGRVQTATGHTREFAVPGAPEGIAYGPDGNMWFTVDHGIGKITPSGAVTEYSLSSKDNPAAIIAGPDGNLWFTDASQLIVGRITTSGVVTEFQAPHDSLAIAAGPDGNLYATSSEGVMQVTPAGVITEFVGCGGMREIILGPDNRMWMTGCQGIYLQEFDPATRTFSNKIIPDPFSNQLGGLTVGADDDIWIAGFLSNTIDVYEERVTTIGIRLNGELSYVDPNYGFELGYAVGTKSTQTQTIGLKMGESVKFRNVDTEPHSAAFLGDATSNNAPWPGSFNGSTTRSPAGTAIGTTGWATGSLKPNTTSPIYETGLPGFYMIGCQYHYDTNQMRTVIIVH